MELMEEQEEQEEQDEEEGYAAAFAFASNRRRAVVEEAARQFDYVLEWFEEPYTGVRTSKCWRKGLSRKCRKLRLPFSQSNDIIVYCEVARGGGIFSPIRMNSLLFPCVDGFFANCGVHENERNVIFSFFPTFVCFGETRLSPSMHDLVSTFLFSTIPG